MLAKRDRLKKKSEFQRVFKEGKGVKEDFLFLKFALSKSKENRFGVVVSQKVSKKATTRNKIKRRIKAAISKKTAELKKGIDAVFVALPGLETKKFWEIEETMDGLFQKSKLFKNGNPIRSSKKISG